MPTESPRPDEIPTPPHRHRGERVAAEVRRSWRRWKWLVRLVVGVPVAIGLLVLLLMRSPVVGYVAAGRVAALTGCELREGTAYIDLDGTLVIVAPVFGAPSIAGDGGRILSAERAAFDLDWSGVLTGRVGCTAVRLTKPVFRVSQSSTDGSVNLGVLTSKFQGAAPAGMGLPPAVDVLDGAIELGEHDSSGRATVLRSIPVEGSFIPTRADPPVYAMRMYEVTSPDQGPARGMVLDGRVDLSEGKISARLMYLPLESWPAESVPSSFSDLWRRLNIQGEVREAKFVYSNASGLELRTEVEDVSMNALIPADSTASDPTRDLVLSEVNGSIQLSNGGLIADLTGKIEDQPGLSTVHLQTYGLELNSALECRILGRRVSVSKNPEFLPYVPPTVRQYFEYFSGPTADVDAVVVISRGPPVGDEPAAFKVGGNLAFRNGTAAFHRFPYPFHAMTGKVEFDERQIRILDIRGRGPSGAVMAAHGVIGPLTDDAGVDIGITVLNVPLDEHLLGAMRENRRRVVEAVFNAPAYQRLLDAGVVRMPNRDGADGSRAAPPMALGGIASIDVRIKRVEGPESNWSTDVDVFFQEAGLVPEPFPMPMLARNLRLHISDTDARLISGEFTGLSGGAADVQANVSFLEGASGSTRADIQIAAASMPVDNLLINALPDAAPGADGPLPQAQPAGVSAKRLVTDLGLGGAVGISAAITAAPDPLRPEEGAEIGYDITLNIDKLSASPRWRGEATGLVLKDFGGVVRVTPRAMSVAKLEATIVKPVERPEGAPVAVGRFGLDAVVALGGAPADQRGGFQASVHASDLDLAQPIERVVGVFSDDAAEMIADLRRKNEPQGRLDAAVTVHRSAAAGDDRPDVRVELDRMQDLSIAALGGRLGVDLRRGRLRCDLPVGKDAVVTAEDAAVALKFEGADAGEALLDGSFALDRASGTPRPPAEFEGRLEDWSFESPLVPPLVKRLGDASVAERYAEFAPSGRFRAAIALKGAAEPAGGVGEQSPPSRLLLTGFVEPSGIAFNRRGRRVEFERVSGRLSFSSDPDDPSATRGTIDGLVLSTPNWRAWADGDWSVVTQGTGRRVTLDTALGLDAAETDERLLSLLPGPIADGLESLDVKVRGPVELVGGRLSGVVAASDGEGAPGDQTGTPSMGFAGRVRAAGVSADVGVAVDSPAVALDIDWPESDSAEGRRANVRITMPRARVATVDVTDALVEIRRGGRPGVIAVPTIEAACHGGRVSGEAEVVPPDAPLHREGPAGEAARPRSAYRADVRVAGVQFAPVLSELTRRGAAADFVGPLPEESTEADPSRGEIDARLSIAGVGGDVRSRIGRGAVRVSQGQVVRLPVVFPLLQVSNFVLPFEDRFNELEASFHIAGRLAVFEDIAVRSRTISLVGAGTLAWPSLAIDMHFNSRSNSRIPLLSPLFEAVRNELVTTHITGTIADPHIGSEAFFGVRSLLRALAGPAAHGASPDADQIEAGVMADRTRLRRGADEVPTAVPRAAGEQPY